MLTKEFIREIQNFVASKPRSVQEIAQHIKKNWRTADRYIDQIIADYGTLATRTFREGTRGALKIVYWATPDKMSHSVFQEQLEKEILRARWKEDFSAFDIYQYIAKGKKSLSIQTDASEERVAFNQITKFYEKAEKQLLIFSGNLTFLNFRQGKKSVFDTLDGLVKKGITIKVLCRVDLNGKENIERLLSLNMKYGRNAVEVRHRFHPLRATIIDKQCFDIKEIKEPTGRLRELDKRLFIFYNIREGEWVEWLTRIFWKLFNASIDAQIRLEQLNMISTK
jgi:hypothetical protein